ncbi:lysophospholipase [Ornithinimicrobium tianjinense]|uniref:Lysophospholipase n=2 Tax=Ornithinimicrobium tianjinense TaxID=1195761 RepID=A0A917BWX2_9MICO|nr:lysophospholipase [Ornithinimicrobium tianjinense]
MSARQWAPYPALLPDAEVVSVDLPGHGTRTDEPFTLEGALATIGAAVGGRAPGRPVVLAGHSLGGYLCSLYAAAHPDALDALVLIGATADPANRLAVVYRAFARVLPYLGADRMGRVANRVVRLLGVRGGAADALPDGTSYAALPAAWEAVMEHCGPDLLQGVRCPVYLVNGQFDQMRLDVARYAAACAAPHVVTIPRATHFVPLTHPEAVAEVLVTVVRDAVTGAAGTGPSPAPPRSDPGAPPTMGE